MEEQFYIAIPLLTKFGGRKLLSALSAVLIVVSYLFSVHCAKLVYSGESGQWVNSWFQFQFFAAGAFLAILLHGRVPRWSLGLRALAFLAAAALWVFAVLGPGVKSYDAHTTVSGEIIGWLMVLAGSVLFFLSALGTPERFVPRWLTYLGRISFGLYMFHSLIFHLVFEIAFKRYQASLHISERVLPYFGTTLVLLLTILVASISYAFFEKPFLKLKNRFTFVRSRPE